MTHIANCIRLDAQKSSVYIPQETSAKPVVSQRKRHLIQMNYPHTPRRSRSLRNLQASTDSKETFFLSDKSPTFVNLQLQSSSPKYQLWPVPSSASRSPVGLRPTQSSDRSTALSMGRSPTSLSDTAVAPESVPFWQRSGSLSRRRKVSVPELGNTMTTVQESAIDSRKFVLYSLIVACIDRR